MLASWQADDNVILPSDASSVRAINLAGERLQVERAFDGVPGNFDSSVLFYNSTGHSPHQADQSVADLRFAAFASVFRRNRNGRDSQAKSYEMGNMTTSEIRQDSTAQRRLSGLNRQEGR